MPQPRRVLTAAEMREVDRLTIESGIPGLILMENAAARVTEFLAERYAPLARHRIVVFCGKGNNGGDGLAIARQLLTRFRPRSLDVLLSCPPSELRGDAAANHRMFEALGGKVREELSPEMRHATLIVDALLGTGLDGSVRGLSLDWIRAMNSQFPDAKVVSVDVPSGMPSDKGEPDGEHVRADATVTFSAPRPCHVLGPNCYALGELRIESIGNPAHLIERGSENGLALVEPSTIADLFQPRPPDSNKGLYGHVLVVAGSRGKTGAAAMTGMASLHSGAGLATVASAASAIAVIAGFAPELMTEFLAETPEGGIAESASARVKELLATRTVLAIGPGIGTADETAHVVRELFSTSEKPVVCDADALNIVASGEWPDPKGTLRVLTPHPGEMARLLKSSVKEVQADRIRAARSFATERSVVLVLKGDRTLIAFPDGAVWINPAGSPAMATGGTGDILTGLIAGLLAQFPNRYREAIAAAAYLHGLAGQIGAREIGEQPFVATDLLRFLPQAMREVRDGGR